MQINKNAMPVRKFMEIIDERRGENWREVVPHMESIIYAKPQFNDTEKIKHI